ASWTATATLALMMAGTLSLGGCDRGRGRVLEVDYVSASQVPLRDQVAAVFKKTGAVKNGDRVEVLERQKRFVRVRTADGTEGWIEQRHLVTQQVYAAFEKLSQQNQDDPVQARGTTRNDTNIPLEIAQYAEGQRFIALFVLDEMLDGDKKVPQYLALLSESKESLPYDYDQVRVFTWNVRRHRYETAYRERHLEGVLPATVGREDFAKEGKLPVFILRIKDDNGTVVERKYKLNTPIVRRVLATGGQREVLTRKRHR